ncbi:carboxylesterase/lipase family protein [Pseudolysinimonas sp.]|jgi:para-nitrobenzyl esterase|uniref:carboxylesterase/lipase family protein n=1 Tax=Pseudolysinimonas sp. TaxID=2680009 RepID=UPI0037846D49
MTASAPARHTIWWTGDGRLRGIDGGGLRTFLGVPYGASTAGANRFRPPQPVEPWEGERDAFSFGDSAPQVDTRLVSGGSMLEVLGLLYPRGGWPVEAGGMSEDCLRLNVWAPSAPGDSPRPVILWLHGGGFVHGSGNEQVFNGDILSRDQDVVVVTVTHRLGALGFADLRAHGAPRSANAGMLDIVQALQWVHRNIAGVGGDPENITVVGQSGGCAKAAVLAAMPAARDLIRRVVLMSFPATRIADAEVSAELGTRLLAELGVVDVEGARDLPVEAILDAQSRLRPELDEFFGAPHTEIGEIPFAGFGPSLDDVDVPEHPFSPTAASGYADKEVVIGFTSHEFALMLAEEDGYRVGMSDDEAIARLQSEAEWEAVTADHPDEPVHLRVARALSDRYFRHPTRLMIERSSAGSRATYAYEFTQTSPVLEGLLGASHSLDLAYFFGTVDRIPIVGDARDRHAVSAACRQLLGSFARDGVPVVAGERWEPWRDGEGNFHVLGPANRD